MKLNTILNRYIFKELLPPFFISLMFLTFIFLMTRIPDITNMVVNYNTGLSAVFLLILYSLPRFLEFTLPMSVMISVLLTFMRMSGDNEIIALKGGGITLYRLLPPVVLFCFLGTCLTMWVTVFGVPWGKLSFSQKGAALASSSLKVALKERQFNNLFDDVMIYVTSIDIKTGILSDIFIEDARSGPQGNITIAASGMLMAEKGKPVYTLRLHDGLVNQVNLKNESVNVVHFDTYDITFDMSDALGIQKKRKKDYDEMGLSELLAFIRNGQENHTQLNSARMELHEKFSIPFACVALGILSFSLALQSISSRRSSGFGMALLFFLFYYLMLAVGWSAGESGAYPPLVGMWVPDIIIAGIGIYFLVKAAREEPVVLPDFYAFYLNIKLKLSKRAD